MEKLIENFKKNNIRIIAIDGRCASGKTTISKQLAMLLNAEIIHLDDFFLSQEQKTKERLAEVGGNIDYDRFLNDVLLNLKSNKPFKYQVFDCNKQSLTNYVNINNNGYIIIEGSYAHHPKFSNYYDYKIFLNVNEEVQIERLKIRNPRLLNRFIDEWIPLEEKYFQTFEIRKHADYLIDTSIQIR